MFYVWLPQFENFEVSVFYVLQRQPVLLFAHDTLVTKRMTSPKRRGSPNSESVQAE